MRAECIGLSFLDQNAGVVKAGAPSPTTGGEGGDEPVDIFEQGTFD